MGAGDKICQQCDSENPAWYAGNELWNKIYGNEGGVLCPLCFQKKCDLVGINIIFTVEILKLTSQT